MARQPGLHHELDTTYFFAASIVRAKGTIHPAEKESIGLFEVFHRVTR